MSRLSKAVIVGVLTGVLGLIVSLSSVGIDFERDAGLGLLFKLRGTREAPSDVIIVAMDKLSSEHLNLPTDPKDWPRTFHCHLTETLAGGGAAVITFDLRFEQATRHDTFFADAMGNARNVVLCEFLTGRETIPLTDEAKAHRGDMNVVRLVPPIPSLAGSAVAIAPFPLPSHPEKVSQYWTFKTGAGDMPTLPVVSFQIFTLQAHDEFTRVLKEVSPPDTQKLPHDKDALIASKGVEELIMDLRNVFRGDPSIPADMLEQLESSTEIPADHEEHRLLKSLIKIYQGPDSHYLNYYGPPGTIPTISYYDALAHRHESGASHERTDFRGKAVFVGVSEHLRPEEKGDWYPYVFSGPSGLKISGVEIAATAFANILEDMHVKPLGLSAHLVTILLWGLALGISCRFLPTAVAAVIVIGMSLLYLFAAYHQFKHTGSWYPVIIPVFLQTTFAFFGTVSWRYFETNKERQNIREAFGYYLPGSVVDQLARDMADIRASSHVVHGTCLYTDAEQYSTLSEMMDPKELGSLMNDYYETVFEPVRRHGGIVSDVVGDSMLAIWAMVDPDAGLKKQACLAALDIGCAVHQFNQSLEGVRLPTRIGLHSGRMLLGSIGAINHYEYRAVGDIVNTTTRLEGLNKYLGTRILVSGEVVDQLDEFLTRELGEFIFVGKSKSIVVHELFCRTEEAEQEQRSLCATFREALDAYKRQSWEEAIKIYYEARKIHGEDGPSLFYLRLCEEYRENPPCETWNGTVCLDKK